jgi:DNA-binding Lrp family transcriptional regulator
VSVIGSISRVANGRRPDALDERILGCLTRDSRSTFAEIGERVGLSASAVNRRVDRLVQEGVIERFTITVDRTRISQRVEAFVELSCVGQTSAVEIGELVRRHPEVIAAWTVTGEMNALLQVVTLDVTHLEEVLERLRADPRVLSTTTLVVLSRLLQRSDAGAEGATG